MPSDSTGSHLPGIQVLKPLGPQKGSPRYQQEEGSFAIKNVFRDQINPPFEEVGLKTSLDLYRGRLSLHLHHET